MVIASGPLTSDALAGALQGLVGQDLLGFYDAAAPVIEGESIDLAVAYRKGRYGQTADYLNLPFSREQYDHFFEALLQARKHLPHDWEKIEFFEGCLPIEELARRGYDTPRFGPMKPVGLEHPETGERFFAVAQLRQEDVDGRLWSLVGFQTGLKWGDQKGGASPGARPRAGRDRPLRCDAPEHLPQRPHLLSPELNLRAQPRLFVAGVLAGTEGYLESSATGWLAGVNAARHALNEPLLLPPEESMLGGLVRFLTTAKADNFQPMNANWGLVPAVPKARGSSRKERRMEMYRRGLEAFERWLRVAGLRARDEAAVGSVAWPLRVS